MRESLYSSQDAVLQLSYLPVFLFFPSIVNVIAELLAGHAPPTYDVQQCRQHSGGDRQTAARPDSIIDHRDMITRGA